MASVLKINGNSREWQGVEQIRTGHRFAARVVCEQCDKGHTFSFSQRVGADTAIAKIRQSGWQVGKIRCPDCMNHKKETAMKTNVTPINVAPVLETPAPAPTDAAKRVKRMIYQALEDYYDEAHKGYRPGHSDASVADELGASEAFVRTIRETDFGPIAPPSEVAELFAELRAATSTIDALRDRLSKLLEKNHWQE